MAQPPLLSQEGYTLSVPAITLAGGSLLTSAAGIWLQESFRKFLELCCAVAELLRRDPQVAEQRQLQVRQRCVLGIDKVTTALDGSCASAEHQRRQRSVGMAIAVADAPSIKKDHVIEQRPVTIRRRSQFLQVTGEQLDVVRLDPGAFLHLHRIVLVMGQWMMRLGDADLRIGPPVLFA